MMTLEDCYGLLFMVYFALVISAGVGAFARGATGFAVLLVMGLAAPIVILLSVAIITAPMETRNS
jgi:fumarate reductase subunit C